MVSLFTIKYISKHVVYERVTEREKERDIERIVYEGDMFLSLKIKKFNGKL